VGNGKNEFTHVPIPLAVSWRTMIDPDGWLWRNFLAFTEKPREMR
jgi:hypothetical protein